MPRYPHFLIIVAVISKLDLAMNILVMLPVVYAWHINGYNYLSKVLHIVKAFGGLFSKVFIAFVNHELMQRQLPAYIKQVKAKQHQGNKFFQSVYKQRFI